MIDSTPGELLVLNTHAVQQLMDVQQVIQDVEQAFKLHSSRAGKTYPVVREPVDQGIFGIKSGAVEGQRLVGLKAAGFWMGNRALGKEAHQATVLLVDPQTGRAYALLDGNQITTMRTGAAGGIGLRELGPQAPQTLCLFGTGVQAQVQLQFALRMKSSIQQVSYHTWDDKPDPAFEAKFSSQVALRHSTSPNAAVNAADVIITATPGKDVLFDVTAVRAGQHFTCVGADTKGKREAPRGLLERANFIAVDDQTQARELGELQWQPDMQSIEMGELLVGSRPRQRDPDDITVFDMTGLALQDLVVAESLYRLALERGMGQRLAWPW
jgi:alanine dehydrogenase